VNRAPFSHIGGAVIADHGPIGLVEARKLASFYSAEAKAADEAGAAGWVGQCSGRALALDVAAEAAARWRRAAGWADPRTANDARWNGRVG
jgi:hypothetical protein